MKITAKKSDLVKPPKILTIDQLSIGEEYNGFISNIANGYFFITLSPSVTGIISFMDLSNNSELLSEIEENFPIDIHIIIAEKNLIPKGTFFNLVK